MRGVQRCIWLIFCALALAAALSAPAFSQQAMPALRARVTDLTGTLPQAWISTTETKLAELEREKGSQIAVLLVASTEPEAIEQYAMRVAENWKLGRKGVDDGVLFLVAKNDRKMRIEVGYGLEGALNDATCKRIIDEIVKPQFKQGDFPGGLSAGLEAIIKVISGEALPPPSSNTNGAGNGDTAGLLLVLFFVLIAVGIGLKRVFGSIAGAGVASLAIMLIALFLVPLIAALIVAVVSFLIVLFSQEGAFTGYHSSGSSSGWSGGSGGGFSGGGGSFGGGGASGGW